MKDLLRVCPKSHRVIVGLDDRALVSAPALSVSALSSSDSSQWVALAPQTKRRIDPPHNPVQAVAIGAEDATEAGVVVWCAVARHDKSLAVYRLSYGPNDLILDLVAYAVVAHRTAKRVSALCFAQVPPDADEPPLRVVVAADLAGDAVAYSTTPAAASSTTTTRTSETPSEQQDDKNDDDKEKEEDADGYDDPMLLGNTRPDRRLLLGHTASMLTSVAVVSAPSISNSNSFILTADRDEKIRVSAFPRTHAIHGYLLGHTAFVSSLDVAHGGGDDTANQHPWCVTFGGDHTLRLWDYVQCRELAVVSTSNHSKNGMGEASADAAVEAMVEVEDEEKPQPTENNEGEEKSDEDGNERKSDDEPAPEPTQQQRQQPVPSKVAINARGDRIVTICDDSSQLQLWQVVAIPSKMDDHDDDSNSKFEIQPCLTFHCPAQPLAVSFCGKDQLLVLLREPKYFQRYTLKTNASDGTVLLQAPEIGSPEDVLREQLFDIAYSNVPFLTLPASVLERDGFGRLKMEKISEERGNSTMKPWYNVQRKETARERQKRVRKRRKKNHNGGKGGEGSSNNESSAAQGGGDAKEETPPAKRSSSE